ncbi:MAG: hypothetical protein FWF88_00560 [Peptococcaceae bacterium]|nr:hypothetical protein [Peptococcaceae bacterium]
MKFNGERLPKLVCVCLLVFLVCSCPQLGSTHEDARGGRVAGSILQGWMGARYSEMNLWETELRAMRAMGMNCLLLQDPPEPPVFVDCLKAARKTGIKLIVGLSSDTGEYASGGSDDVDLARIDEDIVQAKKTLTSMAEQVGALSLADGFDYGKTIYGWYFNQEFHNSRKFYESFLLESSGPESTGPESAGPEFAGDPDVTGFSYTYILANHLNLYIEAIGEASYVNQKGRKISLNRPLVFSPFFVVGERDFTCDVSEYEGFLHGMFGRVNFRPEDIMMPQDGFGGNTGSVEDRMLLTPETMALWFGAHQRAAQHRGIRLWINNELFEYDLDGVNGENGLDGGNGVNGGNGVDGEDEVDGEDGRGGEVGKDEGDVIRLTATFVERFVENYNLTDKYAEAHMVFSWNHYYDPLLVSAGLLRGRELPGYNPEAFDEAFRRFVLGEAD